LSPALDTWLNTTDFEAIYRGVIACLGRLGLQGYCTLVRKRSEDAAEQFAMDGLEFDLVHIDGNHDTALVTRDVEQYAERLRPGGFVILDDVSWDSVRPAGELLARRMTKLVECVTAGCDDFAVYWNSQARLAAAR